MSLQKALEDFSNMMLYNEELNSMKRGRVWRDYWKEYLSCQVVIIGIEIFQKNDSGSKTLILEVI